MPSRQSLLFRWRHVRMARGGADSVIPAAYPTSTRSRLELHWLLGRVLGVLDTRGRCQARHSLGQWTKRGLSRTHACE